MCWSEKPEMVDRYHLIPQKIIIMSALMHNKSIEKYVKESIGFAELARKLGYSSKGGGVKLRLKEYLIETNIDFSHFKGQSHGKSRTEIYSLDQILIENSTYTNNDRLIKKKAYKIWIIREQVL